MKAEESLKVSLVYALARNLMDEAKGIQIPS